jgi:ABC-type lipoprotein release transport system permease subunit
VLASQLFGVSPVDPATYAAIDALVLAVAAAATLIPALRATAVDPAVALRSE